MADHWKLLANQLGAPGMDAPEPPPKEEDATPHNAGVSRAAKKPAESPQPTVATESTSGFDAPPSEAELIVEHEITVEHRYVTSAETASTSEQGFNQPSAVSQPSQAEPSEAAPKKRKSSWETLARMFNIPIERSAPEEPAEPQRANPQTAVTQPVPPTTPERISEPASLPFFQAETETNPALDEMFGDAPRQLGGWGRKKKRVVDDVSWDVVSNPDDDVEEDALEESYVEDIVDDQDEVRDSAFDDDVPEADARRGRKRRRRGRRGSSSRQDADLDSVAENESPTRSTRDEPVAGANRIAGSGARFRDDRDLDTDVVSAADWDEPESFEIADEDAAQSERRSSRRRRRGRRPREEFDADASDASSKSTPQADERSFDSEDVDIRAARRSGGERSSTRETQGDRGSRRRESAKPTDEVGSADRSDRKRRGRRPDAIESKIVDEPLTEHDDSDSFEDGPKHRNIPTWSDSLESIIAANTENHKRSEQRGGSRGRSRGGRR
ncbi:MAG: hypothetical protein KDB22_11605 [Planctomycetales bacterium]|nr:hypothetical protein [Planctomycetales bacterium]